MSNKSRTKRGDRYAQIPLEAMQSEPFRWLPAFAVRVLAALAAQYSGFNNGGLELTAREARHFGINENELYAGLGLLIKAGFVRRTVAARRRSGKGIPARYAITWRTLGDFPKFEIVATVAPSRDWQRFVPPFAPVQSVRAALAELGRGNPPESRLHTIGPRSKRVPSTRRVKTALPTQHAQGEKPTFTPHAQGEVPRTRRVKKNQAVH